jgi:hypothetical protein
MEVSDHEFSSPKISVSAEELSVSQWIWSWMPLKSCKVRSVYSENLAIINDGHKLEFLWFHVVTFKYK